MNLSFFEFLFSIFLSWYFTFAICIFILGFKNKKFIEMRKREGFLMFIYACLFVPIEFIMSIFIETD